MKLLKEAIQLASKDEQKVRFPLIALRDVTIAFFMSFLVDGRIGSAIRAAGTKGKLMEQGV